MVLKGFSTWPLIPCLTISNVANLRAHHKLIFKNKKNKKKIIKILLVPPFTQFDSGPVASSTRLAWLKSHHPTKLIINNNKKRVYILLDRFTVIIQNGPYFRFQ
jgi:hypothetical protein